MDDLKMRLVRLDSADHGHGFATFSRSAEMVLKWAVIFHSGSSFSAKAALGVFSAGLLPRGLPSGPGRLYSSRTILWLLLSLAWPVWLEPSWAVEPNFGYYDDVPPIDMIELDAMRERIQEAHKRLKRPDMRVPPSEAVRPQPLPPPVKDERDGSPPIDFQEVEELRHAFEQVQSQSPREHAAAPERPANVDTEVQALSERVTALERVLVGTEERAGLAGLIGGYTRHNGFFLMSGSGDFFLRLPVLIQSDLRTFPGGQNGTDPGVSPSTFILQRVRPMVHFRLWRYFRGFMTPDFGNGFTESPLVQGRVQTPDAFAEWDYFSLFRIRVGKFKSPIGLEMLQGIQNLSFMERSLTRNLLPNRDLGAMVWGYTQHGLLEYQLGVFNGVPNANFYQESRAFSSGKTMIARIFTRPFLSGSISWLQGLGAGVGMSWGSVRQNNGQDPMQTETFSYTFFDYRSQVVGDGDRTRVSPQFAWYVGRLGLLAQYVISTQHLQRPDGRDVRTSNDAWSAQVSWFLTDDIATFGHVQPRRPVAPAQGNWGAWEVALRYSQVNIDPNTFVFDLADPGVNAQRAKSTTVGLNWYLNANLRISGNFVHTDFSGSTPAYHGASHEDGLMFRTQVMF